MWTSALPADPPSGPNGIDEAPAEGGIALALSGGGSRAMAFHLGCLRALRDAGILERVSVISSVSGGSVLAALYCHTPGNFDAFEQRVRTVLRRGFLRPAIGKALTTTEGVKALLFFTTAAADRLAAFLAARSLGLLRIPGRSRIGWLRQSAIPRKASRTTILGRVFDDLFGGARLPALRSDRPKLIIVACELRTRSAFYFAADIVGSWRFGSAAADRIGIGEAVSASAAYPVALPALDRTMTFTKGGVSSAQRVILTDGGVYDNLGLAPLWPDRDAAISLHVGRYSRIIACRAGYGIELGPAPSLAASRLTAAFESIFARAQNAGVKRLFELQASGRIEALLHPYLGQDDSRLAYPPPDLVTREEAAGYRTDFSAMSVEWIDRLAKRGEQLTRALLREHWPGFPEGAAAPGAAQREERQARS